MVTEWYLTDNGFSKKASRAGNTYIKDMTKALKGGGNLHAHIKVTFDRTDKVTFDGTELETFKIHGTVRTLDDSEALGKRTAGEEAINRAIWVYANRVYHCHGSPAFWLQKSKMSASEILTYCRSLSTKVKDWTDNLTREGAKVNKDKPTGKRLESISLWTK